MSLLSLEALKITKKIIEDNFYQTTPTTCEVTDLEALRVDIAVALTLAYSRGSNYKDNISDNFPKAKQIVDAFHSGKRDELKGFDLWNEATAWALDFVLKGSK